MSIMRDRRIHEFAESSGIRPADGDQAALLDRLSQEAYELIKIIELERSGIRDGDGYWSGCDVLDHIIEGLKRGFAEVQSAR